MSTESRDVLLRLLAAAERSWARTGEASASLVFSKASNPDYLALSSYADKQAYHSALLHAEHKGAITVEWDTRSGYQNQITRIRLRNAEALAEVLGVVPRWQALERAARALEPWQSKFTILPSILQAWRNGRKPRSLQLVDYQLLVDAARTIEHCRQNVTQDISIRRLSAKLGFDSKHVESLASALDLLGAVDIDQPAREPEEVFGELGIVKHPLPVLLSGPMDLNLADGTTFTVPAPYVGLAPNSVESVCLQNSCRCILSVENLTTFHELAEIGSPHVALIYSNGMPSPSWRQFYGRLLTGSSMNCRILHWGDIDGGGYRIAARIGNVCNEHHRDLALHMMDPGRFAKEVSRRPLNARERAQMERIAQKMGWTAELRGIADQPFAYEQEALDITLPAG